MKTTLFHNKTKMYRNEKALGVFALDPNNVKAKGSNVTYPLLNISTEKELLYFIFRHWGEGAYRIYGYPSGKGKRPYTFWRGEITNDGWKFMQREYSKKEIEAMDKDINAAATDEDKAFWEQQKQEEIIFQKDIIKLTPYGFSPHLQISGTRGAFHLWSDPELKRQTTKNPTKYTKSKRFDDKMSIDDLNEF